jgi:hypothetical protein
MNKKGFNKIRSEKESKQDNVSVRFIKTPSLSAVFRLPNKEITEISEILETMPLKALILGKIW